MKRMGMFRDKETVLLRKMNFGAAAMRSARAVWSCQVSPCPCTHTTHSQVPHRHDVHDAAAAGRACVIRHVLGSGWCADSTGTSNVQLHVAWLWAPHACPPLYQVVFKSLALFNALRFPLIALPSRYACDCCDRDAARFVRCGSRVACLRYSTLRSAQTIVTGLVSLARVQAFLQRVRWRGLWVAQCCSFAPL